MIIIHGMDCEAWFRFATQECGLSPAGHRGRLRHGVRRDVRIGRNRRFQQTLVSYPDVFEERSKLVYGIRYPSSNSKILCTVTADTPGPVMFG